MFEFLFKRTASKSSEPDPVVAEQVAATAQSASRRAEQVARAQAVAGNEAAAAEFIISSEFADARLIAAEHVHTLPLLEKVHAAMRNTDRRVAKLMQGRIDLIRHLTAETLRAQASIDTAQRLLHDEKLSPNQVAELDRLWQVIKSTPELAAAFDAARAALAARLEAQVALQRAVIDAVAAVRSLAAAGGTAAELAQALERLDLEHAQHTQSPERASLPKHLLTDFSVARTQAQSALQGLQQHQAAFDARQAALQQWQAQDSAALDADTLRRAWSALPRLPESPLSDSLQQQFTALLASVPAPTAAPAPAAEAAPRKVKEERALPPKEAGEQFFKALDGMEAALQEGLLHVASEHDKTLRDSKHGRLTPAQSDRLAHVRAQFKQLADWARWGGNVSREELVKAGEELPAQGLAMSELAKKVGSLRERWKSLDTLSGPAPKSLWERFDAACSVAYAPAAQHFKQLAEERQGNAAKAQELINETAALAAQQSTDWKHVAAASQRVRQAWTRLGTIDRKEKKRLDGEFGAALDALSKPLETQRQIETARREQLIVEVGLLKPSERNTVDMLRALQDKWQELAKALPLERRAEQALWQRFRAACDDIFAKRKETAHAADHERREHLHAREALCASLETAVIPDGDDKARTAAIHQLLRDTRSAWNATGPVPRASEAKIEQRYQAAVALVQAQADAITERAGAAQANALRDKLRLCQALETAVNDGGEQAQAQAWGERWSALPPLDAHYERSLHQRFAAAQAALDGDSRAAYAQQLQANLPRLQEEVLRLEIVAGVDSGAEYARDRLKMQVEVLQSSLKSGQKPLTQVSQLMQLCAIPALSDVRTASRIEALLRRIGAGAK
ncbi:MULTISPECIES: DUF349 domain-containing protein [unclassified Janthinobacterium]|uniref:DUF349 domain-containing protein n=1 Tax=unclassified Janthinobacterium TaxID=2610881 RepID=UPI00161BF60C|nr:MULTISPECIES: DUF349 domain-containing protein [unclassified Janthinobacterium]MBB5369050.1 hypothetical protein [Janthinobacterium sp. K2C7]MBB5381413.1 hypothetical protein [Janthinobacterium sp. K2Li3]MBB5387433.1 hypothetical protein [Janthinobacterium sp. K2E3]